MYKIFRMFGKNCVICANNRSTEIYKEVDGVSVRIDIPAANFQGTGMALTGILKGGQTLEEFAKDKELKNNRLNKMR